MSLVFCLDILCVATSVLLFGCVATFTVAALGVCLDRYRLYWLMLFALLAGVDWLDCLR